MSGEWYGEFLFVWFPAFFVYKAAEGKKKILGSQGLSNLQYHLEEGFIWQSM